MTRPCICDRCATGPYTGDQCRLCWLYRHDTGYRALWDGRAVVPDPPCRHLGAATGGTIACPGCGGTVALKSFACAVHGSCTIARAVADAACCAGCPDRDPPLVSPLPSGERGRG
jgi:hypothetical protein